MEKYKKLVVLSGVVCGLGVHPLVQAKELAGIQEAGEIIMGTENQYPPFEWIVIEDGKESLVGIDVELGKYIADKLKVQLVEDVRVFDALIPSLKAGKVDMVIAGLTRTEERAKQFDFSEPYYQSYAEFLVSSEQAKNYQALEDFHGKKVGVLKGSSQETYVREELPEVEMVVINQNGALIESLKSGRVDAVLMNDIVIDEFMASNEGRLERVEGVQIEEEGGFAVAIQKGQPELLKAINEAINELKESGQLDQWIKEFSQLAEETNEEQ
ncbi:ABC transporter substrate-binding protein [Hutsoniella sourekii]